MSALFVVPLVSTARLVRVRVVVNFGVKVRLGFGLGFGLNCG